MRGVLQGLPYDEPYVAVFENMDTVVFFNGCGNEAQLWQQFAGGVLPTREIEGASVAWASTSGSTHATDTIAKTTTTDAWCLGHALNQYSR